MRVKETEIDGERDGNVPDWRSFISLMNAIAVIKQSAIRSVLVRGSQDATGWCRSQLPPMGSSVHQQSASSYDFTVWSHQETICKIPMWIVMAFYDETYVGKDYVRGGALGEGGLVSTNTSDPVTSIKKVLEFDSQQWPFLGALSKFPISTFRYSDELIPIWSGVMVWDVSHQTLG